METPAPYGVGRPARISGSTARAIFLSAFGWAWRDANLNGPQEGTPSVLDRYHSDPRAWTACMVGATTEPLLRDAVSPDWPGKPVLRDAISRYAKERGYPEHEIDARLRTEGLARIDLTFAGGAPGVPAPSYLSPYHYARRFELLVEHENDPKSIYVESWKLLHVRADLAVLVAYDPHDGRQPSSERPLDTVQNQVRAAVDESDGVDPERLLIILGHSLATHPWVGWRAYSFDHRGWLSPRDGMEVSAR